MMRIFPVLLLLFGSCAALETPARYEESRLLMGTEFRIVLYSSEEQLARIALDEAWARLERLEDVFSDYRDQSEVSLLSRSSDAAGERVTVPLSQDLWYVLSSAQLISRETDGAFDVTVGPFVRLWRRSIRQQQLPSPARLDEARRKVGHEHLELLSRPRAARLAMREMRLDLGGIAKGYSIDQALLELSRQGIESALIDAGGDIVVSAAPPGQSGWKIALEGSAEGGSCLLLSHGAVASSGDSYRFVDLGGVRYSHLIDPRTGLGLTSSPAVTVLAGDAMTADACASAASVLGPETGLPWLERRIGVEGRFWVIEKAPGEACETSGFARRMIDPTMR